MSMCSLSGVRQCSLILISPGFCWSHTQLSGGTWVGVPINHQPASHLTGLPIFMGWRSLLNLQGPKRAMAEAYGSAGASAAPAWLSTWLSPCYPRSRCAVPAPQFCHPLFLELVIRERGRKWGSPLSKENNLLLSKGKGRKWDLLLSKGKKEMGFVAQ